MESLWVAKTGLEAQQTRMTVVSQNLANVNTTGYKRQRAMFEDLLYQNVVQTGGLTSQQTEAPTGLNVGTGVRVVSTDDMQVEDAPVEVVEYDDARGLQVRIYATATPVQLLRVVEAVEDVIDDVARLGGWQDATGGRWRGLALRA